MSPYGYAGGGSGPAIVEVGVDTSVTAGMPNSPEAAAPCCIAARFNGTWEDFYLSFGNTPVTPASPQAQIAVQRSLEVQGANVFPYLYQVSDEMISDEKAHRLHDALWRARAHEVGARGQVRPLKVIRMGAGKDRSRCSGATSVRCAPPAKQFGSPS